MQFLEKFFALNEHKTSVRQECLAGLTNFMAMAYIVFVVPGILADAGMPRPMAVSATIWATVLGTLVMGLWARFPVAVAPGLGVCAYFTYYICGGAGFTWQTALGAVFISGIVFLLLTVTHVRQMIIDAVPTDLKYAIVVGIGAFIAFIGMKNCGLVVADKATFVTLGNICNPETLLAALGVFLTGVFMVRGLRGAMLLGIACITLIGLALGVSQLPAGDLWGQHDIFPTGLFMQMDINGALSHGLLSIIISLTLVDMFDSMGVLIGLGQKAGFMREDGRMDKLDRAMVTDSVSTMSGAMLGTPTVTAYLECAAGVAAGGRTGLTAVVTAGLFVLALFLTPLVLLVPGYATAPVLILVGALMLQDVGKIDFSRFDVALPAFLTIITMPLTFNIATGFGFGIISWILLRVLAGKWQEVNPILAIIAVCFAVNFALR